MNARPPRKGAPLTSPGRARSKPEPQPNRAVGALSQVLDGHGHDVWGVLLILAGIVGGFGVYANSAGPVGRGESWLLGVLVGLLRYLLPPLMVVGGVLLIRGPRVRARDEDEAPTEDRAASVAATRARHSARRSLTTTPYRREGIGRERVRAPRESPIAVAAGAATPGRTRPSERAAST